ncbi:unnamed protein product [Calicophoron daubneyi]|uniref:Ig-like domain-containing protein n=1 Tax=Calicophoron daubneyi TaxID=300641 RepID=A0AAV2TS45_CALDB
MTGFSPVPTAVLKTTKQIEIQWVFFKAVCALALFFSVVTAEVEVDTPHWQETDVWSTCSTSCGPGVQRRQYRCIKRDVYDIITILDDDQCGGQPHPAFTDLDENHPSERPCNLGSCEGYRWRISPWGHCSQTCGGFGIMSRDVECVYTAMEGDIPIPESEAEISCGRYPKPEKHTPCNQVACKPELLPEPWGKCIQNDPCRPGRQVRQISCVSLQTDGTHRILPRAACYRDGQVQPRTWRRCFVASTSSCKTQIPSIDTDSMTVVQMRKAKVLNLQVGQHAFVIPFTRLSVRCPVHYYSVRDIVWNHPMHGSLTYSGAVSNRLMVDRRGRLRIRSFRSDDAGDWECIAGNNSAIVSLTERTPAAGFHDWVQRNRLWTKGMMSDDPKDLATVHAIVQWVEGPWSACSVSCGSTGQQYRIVRCERVDTRFYEILDDQACLDKLLPKPPSSRKCLKSKHCPAWVIEGADSNVCTNRCLAVGQGSIRGNLTCRIGSRDVQESQCNESEKPDMSCPNPKCQVEWKIGPWSQCSRSCGGVGVKARQLVCIWAHSGEPAGPLCYANQIPTPEVIEQCEAPPCKLDCLDFSKHCPKKLELCKFTLYRYQCCASCKQYMSSMVDLK